MAEPKPRRPAGPSPLERLQRAISRAADAAAERPAEPEARPRGTLDSHSRRNFLMLTAGVFASATAGWWVLPERTKQNWAGGAHDALDTLTARIGLTKAQREKQLNRVLTFDDDVAEALASRSRSVRTYDRPDPRPLRNNYHGRTPSPDYLPGWRLRLSGLASGRDESLSIEQLTSRFARHDMNTRLVCVEGWSHVVAWGGFRFADLLEAFPPAPQMQWAALRCELNLDSRGRPEPYYVSLDLHTARHPQAMLATHHAGAPLTVAHGAPLRLVAPMKLGLKNIKAITDIAYTVDEPADYWNERGYSRYDGL